MKSRLDRIRETEARLIDYVGDMPSTEGSGGKGTHSDRTGSLAFRFAKIQRRAEGDPHPDPAFRDLMDLRRIRQRITARTSTSRDERDADNICHRWQPLTENQAARLRAESGAGDPGCRSHARVTGPSGRPMYEPCHPGLNNCQWCTRTLARIVLRDGHGADDMVHPPVIRWREKNPDSRLTDDMLDRLLSGKVVV